MRAFWAATIVVCLLVAGARPAELDVRERDTTHIDVAVHARVASAARRWSAVDAHLRPLFIVTVSAHADDVPARSAIIVATTIRPVRHDERLLAVRSSRGPPHC